jgi:prepilin-type N-terminal cleavage/methylation domain-containing protein/prepilin-type processing-associated H-X9-DG protein
MRDIRKQDRAFTLIEMLVIVAIIGILATSLLPALARSKPLACRLTCANNLKQVGLAFRTWAAANGGYMPMSVPKSQGGASEDVGVRQVNNTQAASRGVSKMFLCLSNELHTPRILFCPVESEYYRQTATTFAPTNGGDYRQIPYTNDLNVTYFIGVDAQESSPRMLLTGDHNLGGNANPPTVPFLAAVSTGTPYVSLGTNFNANQGPAFLDNTHSKQGNVGMADGSVEWFNRTNLQNALKSSGDRGRSAGNFSLATGATSGAGCNRTQFP